MAVVSVRTRRVSVAGREFEVRGVSDADPYFLGLETSFEQEFERVCEDFIEPDFRCIDLGANIGLKAIAMALSARNGGVLAVEGAPRVAAALEDNVRRAGLRHISCLNAAAGREDGQVRFDDHSAWGRVAESGPEVPMYTIGSIAKNAGFAQVDFIKIDTEGYEFEILRGAIEQIASWNSIVFMEFNSWTLLDSGFNPLRFSEWLFDKFQFVGRIHPHLTSNYVEQLPSNGARTFVHDNITRHAAVQDILLTTAPERLAAGLSRHARPRTYAPEQRGSSEDVVEAGDTETSGPVDAEAAVAAVSIMRRNLATTRAHLAQARADLEAMRGSTSWRATAPLRALSGALRRPFKGTSA